MLLNRAAFLLAVIIVSSTDEYLDEFYEEYTCDAYSRAFPACLNEISEELPEKDDLNNEYL